MSDLTVTPLQESEWQQLKKLRIQALTDSPDAFSPTAEEALTHDDPYWIEAAKRLAQTDDSEIFIARRDDQTYGLVSSQMDEGGTGHIGAMWLDASERGKGTGRKLLESACEFLLQRGCSKIELSVTESNHPAISLYLSRGFIFNGKFEPLRDESPLKNLFMELPI